MKLKISNFAKIEEAEIKIDGITVICGDNDTGKSTVGKILFSIFNYDNFRSRRVKNDFRRKLYQTLIRFIFKDKIEHYYFEIMDNIYDSIDYPYNEINADKLVLIFKKNIPYNIISNMSDETIYNVANDILRLISVSEDKLTFEIMSDYFGDIFEYQINNLFNKNVNSVLELEIKKQKMNIEFKNDECVKFESDFNIIHNAFYIDNPFIVNDVNSDIDTDNFILEKTIHDFISDDNKNVFDSVKNKEILEKVYDVLNSVMNAKIINKNDNFYLHYNKNDVEIKLPNLSAGLKSFVIIKRLLENGSLNEKDVLILDEPEIHLHPKWQLIYAELIVLLQKYFNLTITITTHSHYFLEAINRFSKRHNIDERVNFYITELAENQCNVIFKNVNDNLDIIYKKMYEPLEILKNMRDEEL
ncbi:ABC transporter ATP-binding protein [Brachyspira hampsonii 30446]|uniref:ABC transporter ATP-binding protein n=1 Tax=Brachyspira hampsonii 30446 TaxID=1289135 RepID=A0A2U4FKW0_9SPIR|nr:AAA family ATPase [Brachyspira hampsonii]EKV58051.1 ABC transporter ATP-binding protein [Brachyspira hampsonii 30446]MBW5395826.1 ATP-binding protein [Brachyspira hampsonii]OEJ16745.1 ABC transporter ATP-binding protein [Brachyspira hampsonii]